MMVVVFEFSTAVFVSRSDIGEAEKVEYNYQNLNSLLPKHEEKISRSTFLQIKDLFIVCQINDTQSGAHPTASHSSSAPEIFEYIFSASRSAPLDNNFCCNANVSS